MRLLAFGLSYTARALIARLRPQGWQFEATFRRPEAEPEIRAQGIMPVSLADQRTLNDAVERADALLISAPPNANGCPALGHLASALAQDRAPSWIGYLSSTGVYGDRQGGWVFEDSLLSARSVEGARRVAAEAGWLQLGAMHRLTVQIFRLPGLYGPGRSAFDRLREGKARQIIKPGQVFGRVHIEDVAAALAASLAKPRAGGVYNLCDDRPSPPQDVLAFAADLLGLPALPETPWHKASLPPIAARFYGENKRVSNSLAKAALGWRPRFPSYVEGLVSILAGEAEGS